jgi:hypothetical protein
VLHQAQVHLGYIRPANDNAETANDNAEVGAESAPATEAKPFANDGVRPQAAEQITRDERVAEILNFDIPPPELEVNGHAKPVKAKVEEPKKPAEKPAEPAAKVEEPKAKTDADDFFDTGTAGATEATAGLEEFLRRVLVWPDPNSDTGWINLHWRTHGRKGITGSQAFKTLEDVLGFIRWSQGRGKDKVADLYFCTSLQKEHGELKQNDKYAAKRSADNAESSKLLFADVDKYESKDEARKAIEEFCEASHTPSPTALVDSGGGIHAYWINKEPLPPAEWQAHANGLEALMTQQGLKHDKVTTDIARILRPPETHNYKKETPRPTLLLKLVTAIDFKQEMAHLLEVKVDPEPKKKPAKAKQDYDADLTLMKIESVEKFCLANPDKVRDTITGEPDWEHKLARPIAHQSSLYEGQTEELWQILDKISKLAPGYDEDENRTKFEGYVKAAKQKPANGVKGESAITIGSFFGWAKSIGWVSTIAWARPGHEADNRKLIQQQIAADPKMYSRNGLLVRLRVPEEDDMVAGTKWEGDMPGTSAAQPADVMLCAEQLTWLTYEKGKLKRAHVPRQFVCDYIPQLGGKGAKRLRGLTRLPIIDDAGNVRCFSGYDPKTGLFNDQPIDLDIPETVSKEEAQQLVEKLLLPFSKYKFKDPTLGPAIALSGTFTAVERIHLALAPMYGIRSPMAGTGKSKIGELWSALMTGTAPAIMTWGSNNEEFEKRLSALLMQTPAMVMIDNANNVRIQGAALEQILTTGRANLRILGKSEMPLVDARTFLVLTGCSPVVMGDMARRIEMLDIMPRSPDPERDPYDFDPVEYVQENRKELLEAIFSCMKAFRQAGMPSFPHLPAVGSFKDWSRKVRDLVYWLTELDVAEGFRLNKVEDPHRQNDAALLEALYVQFSDRFQSADVMEVYNTAPVAHRGGLVPTARAVCDALDDVLGERNVNSKAFGYWARGKIGAYTGDFVLEKCGDTAGGSRLTIKCTNDKTAERLKPARDAVEAARKKAEEEAEAAERAAAPRSGGRLI